MYTSLSLYIYIYICVYIYIYIHMYTHMHTSAGGLTSKCSAVRWICRMHISSTLVCLCLLPDFCISSILVCFNSNSANNNKHSNSKRRSNHNE